MLTKALFKAPSSPPGSRVRSIAIVNRVREGRQNHLRNRHCSAAVQQNCQPLSTRYSVGDNSLPFSPEKPSRSFISRLSPKQPNCKDWQWLWRSQHALKPKAKSSLPCFGCNQTNSCFWTGLRWYDISGIPRAIKRRRFQTESDAMCIQEHAGEALNPRVFTCRKNDQSAKLIVFFKFAGFAG